MFRRGFLTLGALAAGAALAGRWEGEGAAAEPGAGANGKDGDRERRAADSAPRLAARADACILLWMNGGPSHLDTFDPKPGRKVSGPTRAIATSAPGVRVAEHLPGLAREAKRLAIVRGLSSKEGSHERARHLGHTGYSPNPTAAHPALGAWASSELGGRDPELPAYVSLSGPGGDSGFLGSAHDPFVVSEPGRAPDDTDPGVPEARFERRRAALAALEDGFAARTKAPAAEGRRAVYDKAFRLMRSPRLGAFDLAGEPESVKAAYGATPFGRGCLTARRLVESGVRFVEVMLDGWDTHKDNFGRVKKLCGALDPAMTALLRDLAERSLLDRTLVVWMGDFGRSPQINGDDGRDHHPGAFSAVLAGGGVRGGTVVGKTNEDGDKVVEDAVSVADLFATVMTLMGMDPRKSVPAPNGRPIGLSDGGSVVEKLIAR
jgi:hypothetical protein